MSWKLYRSSWPHLQIVFTNRFDLSALCYNHISGTVLIVQSRQRKGHNTLHQLGKNSTVCHICCFLHLCKACPSTTSTWALQVYSIYSIWNFSQYWTQTARRFSISDLWWPSSIPFHTLMCKTCKFHEIYPFSSVWLSTMACILK